MGILDKYIKAERKYEDVHLADAGKSVKFRIPNQRELEMMYKEFEEILKGNDGKYNSTTVAIVIKLFSEIPEIQTASIEEIKNEVLDMSPKDIVSILVWFYEKIGINMESVMGAVSDEDFRYQTGTEL